MPTGHSKARNTEETSAYECMPPSTLTAAKTDSPLDRSAHSDGKVKQYGNSLIVGVTAIRQQSLEGHASQYGQLSATTHRQAYTLSPVALLFHTCPELWIAASTPRRRPQYRSRSCHRNRHCQALWARCTTGNRHPIHPRNCQDKACKRSTGRT